jgi:hypothetical protein
VPTLPNQAAIVACNAFGVGEGCHRLFVMKAVPGIEICRCFETGSRDQRAIAKARTGKVPKPFTLTGTAKKRKSVFGAAAKFVMCSTMGIS